QGFIWAARVDPSSGKLIEAPRRVSLTSSNGYSPQFSPDGKLIAFGREGNKISSLVVLPAAGGAERVLATGRQVRRLRWAPDGAGIYYLTYADSALTKPQLFRAALTGGTSKLVHDFSDARIPFGPTNRSDAPEIKTDTKFL